MASRNELNMRARVLGLDPSTIPNDSKLEQKILYLSKNATTFAGTLGVQTLTTSGVFTAAETITIGGVVYTMSAALSGAFAAQTLTSNATAPSNGSVVAIGNKAYTFRTSLSSPTVENEVLIGVSAAVALDNLKLAINQGGTNFPTAADNSGAGSTWSTGTIRHSLVNATTNTDTTQIVASNVFGTVGNNYLVSENDATLSWGAATLAGGVNSIANEVLIGAAATNSLDNLKSAINATAGAGTDYSRATAAHPRVTADAKAASTLVITARDVSVTNASIATTETAANASFGAATLASGVAAVVAVAGAGTRDTFAGVAGDANV